jgi:hypothetical protein
VRNLASQDIINLNFSAPFDVNKWWKVFFSANGYHSLYKADFGAGKTIDVNVNAFNFYLQQIFTITSGLTFELSGSYYSPGISGGTFNTDAIYFADAGIQKTLFKKRGNLKISYTDFLRSQRFSGTSDFGGAYLKIYSRGESTQLRINFTYRFGNNQVKAARQHKSSMEDENRRIGN